MEHLFDEKIDPDERKSIRWDGLFYFTLLSECWAMITNVYDEACFCFLDFVFMQKNILFRTVFAVCLFTFNWATLTKKYDRFVEFIVYQ